MPNKYIAVISRFNIFTSGFLVEIELHQSQRSRLQLAYGQKETKDRPQVHWDKNHGTDQAEEN